MHVKHYDLKYEAQVFDGVRIQNSGDDAREAETMHHRGQTK